VEKNTDNCKHKWKRTGLWDGWDGTGERRKNIGGPSMTCVSCLTNKNFTWSEAKKLSPDDLVPKNK